MANERSKLALGTVQFGLDYGVSNSGGKVPITIVRNILKLCLEQNITTLDTAAAYGDSEAVIGKSLANEDNSFQIISKLPNCSTAEVRTIFNNSLQELKKNKIFGYLIHDYSAFTKDPGIFDEIYKLQQEGLIQKIGFSLYYPPHLEEIIKLNLPIQLIQIPFNVFDQRFAYLFPYLNKNDIEIHIRSIFLQGLLFKEIATLPPYFHPFRENLLFLQEVVKQSGLSLSHVLLAFAHLHPEISKIVVGVTSMEELAHNSNYLNVLTDIKPIYHTLKKMATFDERFLLPFNWQLS
ncbi:aldo/keto reductase [Adhaeribacter arboris]|uniref:Aldo/keto reductase n=1 Tax=Adhaeribacter arboris TaxID=2072846 RepID=A0A2T2YAC1_9BACT|nr:aldo/keto reductase [Adhaeribacter arboris]PSR52459.1 aldo/keto reductase [Adhaeribacter arboris]